MSRKVSFKDGSIPDKKSSPMDIHFKIERITLGKTSPLMNSASITGAESAAISISK